MHLTAPHQQTANTIMKIDAGIGAVGGIAIHGLTAAFSGLVSGIRIGMMVIRLAMAANPITLMAILAVGTLMLPSEKGNETQK